MWPFLFIYGKFLVRLYNLFDCVQMQYYFVAVIIAILCDKNCRKLYYILHFSSNVHQSSGADTEGD